MSQVNRKNLLEDSFAQVSAMNAGELRRWLRVSYNSLSCSPLFPLTKDEGFVASEAPAAVFYLPLRTNESYGR